MLNRLTSVSSREKITTHPLSVCTANDYLLLYEFTFSEDIQPYIITYTIPYILYCITIIASVCALYTAGSSCKLINVY